jgi:hypothetical protein
MSVIYLNSKTREITKIASEFSKQQGQSNREFREFIRAQIVDHREEGMDVFKSSRPRDAPKLMNSKMITRKERFKIPKPLFYF